MEIAMRVVVRVGGSVIASPPDPQLIIRYARLLERLRREGHTLVVVVGGGSLARDFIDLARSMGLSEQDQDSLAIAVSRIFASLLGRALGELHSEPIPNSINQVSHSLHQEKIVTMGGLRPGMTTDTVAAMVAERIKADLLVKATDQEGVYTQDPDKHRDAEKIDTLSFEELWGFFEEEKHRAGIHQVLDPEALRILERTRTRTVVVNGFEPENVRLAIEGKKVGTLIQ
ncbi:UMP kinase [Candidatus Bathyarchaeota archaeon]|nr:UMP kinase [Candidatus Bathyarchaeota archaeon]